MSDRDDGAQDGFARRVFRSPDPRAHVGWAAAGVIAYWLVLFVIVGPLRAGDSALLAPLWFFWQFLGVAAAPWAARRCDEALAARRGDRRPLHRPVLAAAAAFFGSLGGGIALLLALVALGLRAPDPSGTLAFFGAMAAGAWLGARLVALGVSREELTLGYDALEHADGLRRTVVALRDIAAVRTTPGGIRIERRGAPTLVIDRLGRGVGERDLGPSLERAARRAREAVPAAASLHREDRALAAWRDDLRAMSLGGTDFRAQALGREGLEAALAHPGASAEERIGAALALREIDAEGATRVRIAAESAVDPALGEALRSVAEVGGDDAAVRAATRG